MNLVIASGKGGVGKSMIASSLTMLFSKKFSVTAADCDADTPNLAIWLGENNKWDEIIPVKVSSKPKIDLEKCTGCGLCALNCRFGALKMKGGKPVLNRFLCEGCGACEAICPQKAIKLESVQNGEIKIKKNNRTFPLVSGQLLPGETGSGKVVDQIKDIADQFNSDLVIIDSAPGTGCPVIAAFKNAGFVVLVAEPTLSGFTDMQRTLDIVKHFHIPYGVVINKWDINPKLSSKIEKWATKKFLGKISYDKAIFRAISTLTPILKTELKAKEEIKNIFNNLEPRITKIIS